MLGLKNFISAFAISLCAVPMSAQFSSPTLQLRTNGLYDLAASPNIGIEIQTDLGWAWQFDYTGAWWVDDPAHNYFSNYAFMTEIRYYFDSKKNHYQMPYTGHHLGLYGQLITFDFEFGKKGYMNRDLDKGWAVGASYGYTIQLSKYWSVDFTAGLGWLDIKYDTYLPSETHRPGSTGYSRTGTREFKWFGPTKLEVSFIYNLNYTNHPKYVY